MVDPSISNYFQLIPGFSVYKLNLDNFVHHIGKATEVCLCLIGRHFCSHTWVWIRVSGPFSISKGSEHQEYDGKGRQN